MPMTKRQNLITSLRNYLIFLKDYGYSEIPLESNIVLGPESNKTNLSSHLPESTKQITMETLNTTKLKLGANINKVREELGDCTRCKLHENRKTIVFGSGNPNADIVFVGEGPGADEDD